MLRGSGKGEGGRRGGPGQRSVSAAGAARARGSAGRVQQRRDARSAGGGGTCAGTGCTTLHLFAHLPSHPATRPADEVLRAAQVPACGQLSAWHRSHVLGRAGHGGQLPQRALAAEPARGGGGAQESRMRATREQEASRGHSSRSGSLRTASGRLPQQAAGTDVPGVHLKGCQCTPLLTSTPSVSLLCRHQGARAARGLWGRRVACCSDQQDRQEASSAARAAVNHSRDTTTQSIIQD